MAIRYFCNKGIFGLGYDRSLKNVWEWITKEHNYVPWIKCVQVQEHNILKPCSRKGKTLDFALRDIVGQFLSKMWFNIFFVPGLVKCSLSVTVSEGAFTDTDRWICCVTTAGSLHGSECKSVRNVTRFISSTAIEC